MGTTGLQHLSEDGSPLFHVPVLWEAILGFFWVVLGSKEQQERANPGAEVLSKPPIIFSILPLAKAGHMAGLRQGGRIFRGMGEKKFEQVG